MPRQFRSNSHALVILIACVIMLSVSEDGFCRLYQGIEDDHTTDRIHGLYEIREEARKFMATKNAISQTNWVVGDPDLRAQVPLCLVPLKVKWVPKSYGLSSKSVMVYCTKAMTKYSKDDQWDVIIDVSPPLGSYELFFNIKETAAALLKQSNSKQTADFPSAYYYHYVGKCLVPLEATINKKNTAVNVTCKKPLQTFFFKGESWTVPVPIQNEQ